MTKNFALRGIRSRLFLLLLIVLVSVLLVEAFIYYRRFETRKSEELQANLEVARFVAEFGRWKVYPVSITDETIMSFRYV